MKARGINLLGTASFPSIHLTENPSPESTTCPDLTNLQLHYRKVVSAVHRTGTGTASSLRSGFESTIPPGMRKNHTIDRIICVGLGSFTHTLCAHCQTYEMNDAAFHQLAALEIVKSVLGARSLSLYSPFTLFLLHLYVAARSLGRSEASTDRSFMSI